MNDISKKESRPKLIVLIVKRGLGSRVVTAAKRAGAEGGTIILGRGTANQSIYENLLGITFEPEKDIVLTMVDEALVDNVLKEVNSEYQLNKPGRGIGFVLDIHKSLGIAHLLGLQ